MIQANRDPQNITSSAETEQSKADLFWVNTRAQKVNETKMKK